MALVGIGRKITCRFDRFWNRQCLFHLACSRVAAMLQWACFPVQQRDSAVRHTNPTPKWHSPNWHAMALSASVQPTRLRTCPDTIGLGVFCAYVAKWNWGECDVVCCDQAKVFGT